MSTYTEPLTRFSVAINTESAAFEDDPAPELARILRHIAQRIEDGETGDMFQTILDENGNDVGRWAHKPESYYR